MSSSTSVPTSLYDEVVAASSPGGFLSKRSAVLLVQVAQAFMGGKELPTSAELLVSAIIDAGGVDAKIELLGSDGLGPQHCYAYLVPVELLKASNPVRAARLAYCVNEVALAREAVSEQKAELEYAEDSLARTIEEWNRAVEEWAALEPEVAAASSLPGNVVGVWGRRPIYVGPVGGFKPLW